MIAFLSLASMKINPFLIVLLILRLNAVFGSDSTSAVVSGVAYDAGNKKTRLDDLMIINLRTNQGVFGKADGSFSTVIRTGDSILIGSTGYEYKKIFFKDSVYKASYFVDVPLIRLNVKLKEVSIFSSRDLESIYTDIQKLGYRKEDFQIEGINALESPITFLYNEFSRLERTKRHNAERINNEKRRELLRQLLANYVAHDIFYLDDNEFDAFIDYANISEEYMKQATQYDFCIYVKRRFENYRIGKLQMR